LVVPAIVARRDIRSKGELPSAKRKQSFRMIDPRRLGVLQAVAAHGSVAGALHLSPPAVSQQLLALERETGAQVTGRRRSGAL
jgi:hypothetical protein